MILIQSAMDGMNLDGGGEASRERTKRDDTKRDGFKPPDGKGTVATMEVGVLGLGALFWVKRQRQRQRGYCKEA